MSGFYDNLGGYEAKPLEEVTTPKKFITEHQNRENLTDNYKGRETLQDKVNNASTGDEPKSSGQHQWWLFFTRQQTKNVLAMGINHQFNRNELSGDNYDTERQRYIDLYSTALKG